MLFWVTVSQPEEFFSAMLWSSSWTSPRALNYQSLHWRGQEQGQCKGFALLLCPPPVFKLWTFFFFYHGCYTTFYWYETYLHSGYPTLCVGLGLPPGQGLNLTSPENNKGLFLFGRAVQLAQRLVLTFSVWWITDYRKQVSVTKDSDYCFINMIGGNTV